MRRFFIIAGLAAALAGCTTAVGHDGPGMRPIPGSITYGGQPRSRLTKAPVGSTVNHVFRNEFGQRVEEVYVIQPDRSLKIVSRHIRRDWLFGDD